MRAREEWAYSDSCINRALPDEMMFVLLGRDAAAPVAIRAWIEERVRIGKNTPTDSEMIHAEGCAMRMEAEYAYVRRTLGAGKSANDQVRAEVDQSEPLKSTLVIVACVAIIFGALVYALAR